MRPGDRVRRRRAVLAIVGGARWNDAARVAGVTRMTLWRWRRGPEFQAEIREALARRLAVLSTTGDAYADGALADELRALTAEWLPSRRSVDAAAAVVERARRRGGVQ